MRGLRARSLAGGVFALCICACTNAVPATGMETGACIDGGCFGELVCLSNLCVDPDWSPDGSAGDDATGAPASAGNGSEGSTGGADSDGSPGSSSDGASTTGSDATGAGSESESEGPPPGSGTSGGDSGGERFWGTPCSGDDECGGGHCFVLGALGGICGECSQDSHCPSGGCSIPNPVSDPPEGSTCHGGEVGGGCETDDACDAGLVCAVGIDVPGVVTLATCSQCEVDADCPGSMLCSPQIDVVNFSGQWACVSPGSVPHSGTCDLGGSGDQACSTGRCTAADVMGLFTLGVCGQCESDFECVQSCNPTTVDFEQGPVGSTCQS